jgi:alkanesulfonate monooxygenase SsuD/methylene tetrahydromethanopterin reductase-like flavin-dependent oxidoreductase (luciferase family)
MALRLMRKLLKRQGWYFRSRGPFSVPRSPQGQPVLIQAGQSGRGQTFAAKWADLVFVGETETAAQEKRAVIEATARDVDALV